MPNTLSDELPQIIDTITKATADIDAAAKHLEAVVLSLENGAPSPSEAATVMWQVSVAYDALDIARKMIYAQDDKLNKFIVPTVLQKNDIDSIRIPALARSFYITPKYSASFVPEQKDNAFQWLRDNGLSALIQETVNAGTLTTAIKDRIVNEGKDVPEELINFRTYNITGSSKYKPK